MKRPIAELVGTGRYTPKRVMTNDEFSKILDTSDQWIRERTGIHERRVAGPDESNACMAKAAAEQVLRETNLTALGATGITGFNLYSMFVAIVGAAVLLWLYHAIAGRG